MWSPPSRATRKRRSLLAGDDDEPSAGVARARLLRAGRRLLAAQRDRYGAGRTQPGDPRAARHRQEPDHRQPDRRAGRQRPEGSVRGREARRDRRRPVPAEGREPRRGGARHPRGHQGPAAHRPRAGCCDGRSAAHARAGSRRSAPAADRPAPAADSARVGAASAASAVGTDAVPGAVRAAWRAGERAHRGPARQSGADRQGASRSDQGRATRVRAPGRLHAAAGQHAVVRRRAARTRGRQAGVRAGRPAERPGPADARGARGAAACGWACGRRPLIRTRSP